MRNTFKRTAAPLKAVLGFDPQGLSHSAIAGGHCVGLDIGWLSLHVGRDANGNEFVVAQTPGSGSFYLGVEPLPVATEPGWEADSGWVYTMNHHPAELFVGSTPPTVLRYAGFTVVHAMDRPRRNFLSVAMPGEELHLVFRNPTAWSTQDWRPSEQPIVASAPVVQPPGATKKPATVVAGGTGDADSDELANALGLPK